MLQRVRPEIENPSSLGGGVEVFINSDVPKNKNLPRISKGASEILHVK